jgi:GNAT superfamily N-acetyltransferase
MSYHIRSATPADKQNLDRLIALSARALSRDAYSEEEIETAIAHVFGVDSELVADGSYFVVEPPEGGEALACGGWSRRKTLFGGDRFAARSSGYLDPQHEPAKIRAFFVHPDYARKGIGRVLLAHCEQAARAHGFGQAEMMATLPGVRLYEKCGYAPQEPVVYTAPDGKTLRFIRMTKSLADI